jgi:hypothetical protein
MNPFQRVIILIWVIALAALAAYPPWMTHNVGTWSGDPNNLSPMPEKPEWNAIELRWFLAWPQSTTFPKHPLFENRYPTEKSAFRPYQLLMIESTGRVRYDLLALEFFMVSVVMAGLFVVARGRSVSQRQA